MNRKLIVQDATDYSDSTDYREKTDRGCIYNALTKKEIFESLAEFYEISEKEIEQNFDFATWNWKEVATESGSILYFCWQDGECRTPYLVTGQTFEALIRVGG